MLFRVILCPATASGSETALRGIDCREGGIQLTTREYLRKYAYVYCYAVSFFLLTAALTLLVLPAVYPILMSIGKIGGETWKE